ncbi:MAG: putative nuclease of restriction endonuclease-like (RecB) superfamily, partial [Saprospiraceae bacterium]
MNEIDKEIALFKNQLSAIKLAAGFKKEIVEKLQVFFLDLKQGYTFTAKKERITLPERFFYIDLVFYNRISRSFILVNFRNGELNEQDLEKM